MYVTVETIITAGSVLGAVTAFGAIAWKLFKWINHQKEQDEKIQAMEKKHKEDIDALKVQHEKDIEELRKHHDQDITDIRNDSNTAINEIREEQTLMTYGLLACLKGLAEQGCDGPVSEAIDKIEKHLNKRAHGQI